MNVLPAVPSVLPTISATVYLISIGPLATFKVYFFPDINIDERVRVPFIWVERVRDNFLLAASATGVETTAASALWLMLISVDNLSWLNVDVLNKSVKTFPYLSYGTNVILGIDRTVPLLSSVEVDETKQVLSTTKDDRSSHLIAIDNVCPIVPPSYKEVRIFGWTVSYE